MRGHSHGGHRHKDGAKQQERIEFNHAQESGELHHKREWKELQQKVDQLVEQNRALKKELEEILAAKKGDAS
ncbi:hypothetical protein BSNK01_22560 [Bacillaceae bacterium]